MSSEQNKMQSLLNSGIDDLLGEIICSDVTSYADGISTQLLDFSHHNIYFLSIDALYGIISGLYIYA
jgi:hypothetical protein